MYSRQRSLFDDFRLEEDEVEEILSPLYPQLWQMVRVPFDDLAVRRAGDSRFRALTEGQTAQWLRPQIALDAHSLFGDFPGVNVRETSQQFYIDCFGKIAVIPKKLRPSWRGRGLTYSSYRTNQNSTLYRQERRQGLPDLPRIIVGYQFIKEMTDIRIWVAFPQGRKLRPCFLMPDQSGAILGVYRPASEIAAEDQDKGFVVRPIRKESEERG